MTYPWPYVWPPTVQPQQPPPMHPHWASYPTQPHPPVTMVTHSPPITHYPEVYPPTIPPQYFPHPHHLQPYPHPHPQHLHPTALPPHQSQTYPPHPPHPAVQPPPTTHPAPSHTDSNLLYPASTYNVSPTHPPPTTQPPQPHTTTTPVPDSAPAQGATATTNASHVPQAASQPIQPARASTHSQTDEPHTPLSPTATMQSERPRRPTPSIAPTLTTTRGIWRDPQRSPPRTQERHRYSAFPYVTDAATSRTSSRSRTRSPLPRHRSTTRRSTSMVQPPPPPPPPVPLHKPLQPSPPQPPPPPLATPPMQHRHKRQREENSPPRQSQPITLTPNPQSRPPPTTPPTPCAPTTLPPPPPHTQPDVPVQRRPPNLPPPRFRRPTDPNQLEIFNWINQHSRSMHIHNEPMSSYVSKVLAPAHLISSHFTDIQLLTHLKWNEQTQSEQFTVLVIPALADRGDAPTLPPPRREALNIPAIKHIFAAHVSEEGNIISILQEGEIIRSILHDTDNVGFFCQAFELSNNEEQDAIEAARVLFNASSMSKNRSGRILTLKAYGRGQKVTHGGESAANDLLLRGEGTAKYTPGKCWVVYSKHVQIEGIAWRADGQPPLSFM